MKLNHPETDQTVETDNPEAYTSQGWAEVKSKAAEKPADPKGK